MKPVVALSALLWLTGALAQPAPFAEPALRYTVSPGDSLIGLSRGLLNTPQSWPEVAQLNRLPDANRIQPGQLLFIPVRLLKGQNVPARLVVVEGDVRIDGQPVQVGAAWTTGQLLHTASTGSAVLRLADGSRAGLSPDTQARLTEHRQFQLKAGSTVGAEDGESMLSAGLRLLRGSIDMLAAKVTRLRPLEITTPTAVVGVRGTQYRVRQDDSPVTRTEVLQGLVRADLGATLGADVAAGFGAALRPGRAPDVQALPAAPDLSAWPQRWTSQQPTLPGDSLPLRLQVAADANFERLVRDLHLPAGGGPVRLQGLADGTWHLRARRINAAGLEGFDARTVVQLDTVVPGPTLLPHPGPVAPGRVTFSWQDSPPGGPYTLEIARDIAFTELIHHQKGIAGGQATVLLAASGRHFWRVRRQPQPGEPGSWSDGAAVDLLPAQSLSARALALDKGHRVAVVWTGLDAGPAQAELAADADFALVLARAELPSPRWELARPSCNPCYLRLRPAAAAGQPAAAWGTTLPLALPPAADGLKLWLLNPL